MRSNTHDYFYKNEDRKSEPKDYFKLVANDIIKTIDDYEEKRILDIGCASGDFIFFLSNFLRDKQVDDVKICGIDIYDELLEAAQAKNPTVKFIHGDITCLAETESKYDIVTMMGVTCYYSDIFEIVNSALKTVNNKGALYVFERFNNYGFDIAVNYKQLNDNIDHVKREGDIYIHAIEKIRQYYENSQWEVSVMPFAIKAKIEKKEGDPYRTWTIDLADGNKGIISGLNLWNEYFLLKFKNKV